ncbi:MAG: hypothetical protein K0Q85_1524 [Caproiciproducens sp.]|jgi:hypothetical protein|nr:hypothetical protein [Caproiciproducens sp.]
MNILEQLYLGNINPCAKCFERGSKYAECIETVAENEKELYQLIGDSEKELLSQLVSAQIEILGFGETERFIEGFRLGAKFMLDTFITEQNSVLRDIAY